MQPTSRFVSRQVSKRRTWIALALGGGVANLIAVHLAFGFVPPHNEEVVLGGGRTSGLQWKVAVHREPHRPVPCFDLSVKSVTAESGVQSMLEVCLPLPGPPKLTTYVARREGRVITLIAGGFEPAISRVILIERSGRRLIPTVRRLGHKSSVRLDLPRFRYVRRAVGGVFCPSRIVALDRADRVLYRIPSVC